MDTQRLLEIIGQNQPTTASDTHRAYNLGRRWWQKRTLRQVNRAIAGLERDDQITVRYSLPILVMLADFDYPAWMARQVLADRARRTGKTLAEVRARLPQEPEFRTRARRTAIKTGSTLEEALAVGVEND